MGALKLEHSGHDFDRASEAQLKALAANDIDTADIHLVNDEKKRIWSQIVDAAEFTDEEKGALREDLEKKDDTNVVEIREFSRQVIKQRDEIRGLIEQYTSEIESHRDVFGVDEKRKLNAADEYIRDFMKQPLAEKRRWLKELKADIDDRIQLYHRAAELMPDRVNYIHTLKRSELRVLVAKVEESKQKLASCEKILSKHAHLFTPAEMAEIREELADVAEESQGKLLDEVTLELEERAKLHKTFEALPEAYRKACSNFAELPLDEKRVAIAKVDEKVGRDFQQAQYGHTLSDHICEEGKRQAYDYVRNLPVDQKIKALQALDAQFQFEKTQLNDPYEALLKKLTEAGTKTAEIEMLRIEFYAATYDKKKNELIPNAQAKLADIEAEKDETRELDGEYKVLLETAHEDGYINERTIARCLTWWAKQKLDKKRETVARFDQLPDFRERVAITERFRALPAAVQHEYSGTDAEKNFYEMNHHERMSLVVKLEKQFGEQNSSKTNAANDSLEAEEEAAETVEARVTKLTQLATIAERQKHYKAAARYYNEILDLDPEDVIAASRLEIVEAKIAAGEGAEETSREEIEEGLMDADEMARLIDAEIQSQESKDAREDIAVLETIAAETLGSEHQTREVEARYRVHDVDEDDREIAEDLSDITDGSVVLNDEGNAEEITVVRNGLHGLDEHTKAGLRRTAVRDIQRSAEPDKWEKSFQIVNKDGHAVSAKKGLEEAVTMREDLKDEVAKKAEQKARARGLNVRREQIREQADHDDDYDIKLEAA